MKPHEGESSVMKMKNEERREEKKLCMRLKRNDKKLYLPEETL